MSRPLLALLLLPGCFHESHWPVCEEVGRVDVADDEDTPAGTAADALAVVALEGTFDGTWADGTPASADLAVDRGEGTAQWVDYVVTDQVKRSFGFGGSWPAIYVECPATLEVPLVADLTSTDGALDLHLADRMTLHDPDESWHGSPDTELAVNLDGSFADATFPVFDDDPDDYEDRSSFLALQYVDGAFVEAQAGWGGSRETEEYSSSIAERVITLGSDAEGTDPTYE